MIEVKFNNYIKRIFIGHSSFYVGMLSVFVFFLTLGLVIIDKKIPIDDNLDNNVIWFSIGVVLGTVISILLIVLGVSWCTKYF